MHRAAVTGRANRAKPDTHALTALGISDVQARVYETLVGHPGSATVDIMRELGGLSRHEATTALARLTQLGLTSHSAERDAHYRVTPPDIAIEALINLRQGELQNVRSLAASFAARACKLIEADALEAPMVEVLAGAEASSAVYAQIQASAQHGVAELERPPYVFGRPATGVHPEQAAAQRRGVPYRIVLQASALEIPGRLAVLREEITGGAHARVLPDVPLKCLLVDQRVAIMPLYPDDPARTTILVRSPALIAALHELFESLWERAAPLSFSGSGKLLTGAAEPDPASGLGELILMLAAGLNDKAIAHQLGVSARTLDRRIKTLLASLDAHTRFQAGWQAALRANRNPKARKRR